MAEDWAGWNTNPYLDYGFTRVMFHPLTKEPPDYEKSQIAGLLRDAADWIDANLDPESDVIVWCIELAAFNSGPELALYLSNEGEVIPLHRGKANA